MYTKTQAGWVIIISVSVSVVYVGIKLLTERDSVLYIVLLVLAVSLILFYNLTVYINDSSVGFRYGIGLIRKEIRLERIAKCEPVRNKWWYGWGIRLLPGCTLYNVNGFGAVELTLLEKNRKIRIGTVEPKELSDIINKGINRNS